MKKFVLHIIVFCIPMFVILGIYVYMDVFKIFGHYDCYYQKNDFIEINRGYVSTENYINKRERYQYDSFIWGNSRSIRYSINDWKTHLPAGSSCYHFDGSAEVSDVLTKKIIFADKMGSKIKNALIVIDSSVFTRSSSDFTHLSETPPILEDNNNLLLFHARFLRVFFNPKFLYAIADYKLNGILRPYMHDIFLTYPMGYDSITNELSFYYLEDLIRKGKYFDKKRISCFTNFQRPGEINGAVISKDHIEELNTIKDIFTKHQTDYRIIISPLYDQVKMNPKDIEILNNIFGKNRVFDFSGVNKWNSDYHNYYEASHYRPCVAKEIMEIVYKDNLK